MNDSEVTTGTDKEGLHGHNVGLKPEGACEQERPSPSHSYHQEKSPELSGGKQASPTAEQEQAAPDRLLQDTEFPGKQQVSV